MCTISLLLDNTVPCTASSDRINPFCAVFWTFLWRAFFLKGLVGVRWRNEVGKRNREIRYFFFCITYKEQKSEVRECSVLVPFVLRDVLYADTQSSSGNQIIPGEPRPLVPSCCYLSHMLTCDRLIVPVVMCDPPAL